MTTVKTVKKYNQAILIINLHEKAAWNEWNESVSIQLKNVFVIILTIQNNILNVLYSWHKRHRQNARIYSIFPFEFIETYVLF